MAGAVGVNRPGDARLHHTHTTVAPVDLQILGKLGNRRRLTDSPAAITAVSARP